MPQWTPQQNNAITARGRNILVSAAAGSGKTAVLVERVIKMVTDKDNPVNLDSLLVVTFTNAAAAEMRFRISKSLNELIKKNPNDSFYKKQLSLLSNAKITTIDAFCSSLVKEHFYELSINQDFSTLDESELQMLEDNVINDIIDEVFEKDDKKQIALIEAFTTPNDDTSINKVLKNILRFIYAQPFPYKWLEQVIEFYNPSTPFVHSEWYEYIKKEVNYLFEYALSLVNENKALVDFGDEKINDKFLTVFNDDYTEISRFKNAFDSSWDSLLNSREAGFCRMASSTKADKSITEKMKANRDIYKTILTKDIKSFLISSESEYTDDAKQLYSQLQELKKLIHTVDERLMTEKREINSFSFSDIEHFAIQLLFKLNDNGEIERTELADNLSQEYSEILVDEYQDTNEAQDLLFSYLSNGRNLFTVGDIKQSIYRFRLAMPHIFNEKKKTYAHYDKDDCEISSKIILDKNFRSRRDICSYVNFVFSNLMREELGELDYSEEEYLNCGAEYNDSDIPSAQLKILTNVKGEDFDRLEATYIAKTIMKKISSGELIKDGDSYRPIRYGDFAILLRKLKGHIDTYAKVLTDFGIPVVCDNSTNLFENNEIRILLSFIRVIDNPMQDIPLLAVMMSPIYGFSADDLAEIRTKNRGGSLYSCIINSDNEKAIHFVSDLSELRKLSVSMSVASFIRYIIDNKGLIAYINAMGNGEQRYQNILKLISIASRFDSGNNVGLTSFIRYIDKISSLDKSVDSATLNSASENAVTIMSIHHSKGLEFPVCLFAGASKQYNKRDLTDTLLLNTNYGLGMKCHNEEQLYQYNSVAYSVIKNKNAIEAMSENLRVLYVAMTRAKEQFITFITVDKLDSKLKKMSANISNAQISTYGCRKINSDADFLLMCGLIHQDGKILRELLPIDIDYQTADFPLSIEITDELMINSENESISFVPYDENIIRQIDEKLSYSYDRAQLSTLGSKLTASSLDDMDKGYEYLTSSKPSFLNKNGLTPAQRGTAMHTFMQFCNYDNAKQDLVNEIERITKLGHISAEQANSLDKDKLNKLFRSDLSDMIFKADKVYREIKVSSFVSAKDLYNVDFDEKVLVQGIADCVIEFNGKLTLIDYKTDKVSGEEELLNRYKKQIMFYKSAIAKTLNMPVESALLYSFYLGKCCYYK